MRIFTTSNSLEKSFENHFASKSLKAKIQVLTEFNDHNQVVEFISCQGKFFDYKNYIRFNISYSEKNNQYEIQILENALFSKEEVEIIHTELSRALDNMSE